MPQDKTIDGYEVRVLIEMVPKNKFGDTLGADFNGGATDQVHWSKRTSVKGLAGLGRLLERIEAAVSAIEPT